MAIGVAHFFAGGSRMQWRCCPLAMQEHSGWAPTYRFLAACYAHMGRLDEARETVGRLRAITPELVCRAL